MKQINIPGYKHILWFSAKDEQKVWLQGTVLGTPKAYGSYRVQNSHKKLLRNKKGNVFMHYAEDLIVPI